MYKLNFTIGKYVPEKTVYIGFGTIVMSGPPLGSLEYVPHE